MCNLIKLNQFKENSECAICYEDFRPGEEQWNHVGGERHEPFHKNCLKRWIITRAECPFDRTPLNSESLLTRTERMIRAAKPILATSTFTAMWLQVSATAVHGISAISKAITNGTGAAAIAKTAAVAAMAAIPGMAAIAGTVGGSIAGLTAESVGAGPTTTLAATLATGIAVGLGTGYVCLNAGAKAITAIAAKTANFIDAAIPTFVQEMLEDGQREIILGGIAGGAYLLNGVHNDPKPLLDSPVAPLALIASGVAGLVAGLATWWKRR